MNFRVEYVRPRSGRFKSRSGPLNKQDEGLFRKSRVASADQIVEIALARTRTGIHRKRATKGIYFVIEKAVAASSRHLSTQHDNIHARIHDMCVDPRGYFFVFKANGQASQKGRVQCLPDNKSNPSHNNGSPETGVHQHVKPHRGIEPRPYKQKT